ncbi:MAG: penicillin-binding protein 2 [Sphingobacteriales bacterium]|nr:penicillin-binding protein 2 [Sphingobacteriales bacterium]
MSVFNQSRKNVIRLIFLAAFAVILLQLINLQLVSSKYKKLAQENAILRKVVYPSRGIIFDRKGKAILDNTTMYDLMVTPSQVKGIDTFSLCRILDIDTAEFHDRIVTAIIKNTRNRPSVFTALLPPDKYAKINENLYKFQPGFFLQERPVRIYPFNTAANILGYLSEVDSNFLKKHSEEGYQMGDYAGMTGMERSYEKVLMGERGIQYILKDNLNRPKGPYENGTYDTAAIAGKHLYTSIDVELQKLGEKLMENKIGSIIAMDPKTGGILALVSAPTYNPNLLTGSERRKHFNELYRDPALPLLNRAVNATYSPGSTFKTLQALIGLHEGVITTDFRVACSGAFYGCGGGKPMKCLDKGVFDLRGAITISDNTYFATVMQRVMNNPKYPNQDSALAVWDKYMYAFGLGHRLGIDIPTEKRGHIPTPQYFDKVYGQGRWNYCNFRSVSIGQGEVDVTPIQVVNEMAFIANKGWYHIPHLVDSIEGGDKFGLLEPYKKTITPTDIPDSIFEVVHDGMQGVVERGTGIGAKIDGITICGKTGTVENYYKGVKQPNHSFFCGFAPRDNPKIAIMCVVENSGHFGGTFAAPICGLMIEKYLKDSIAGDARKANLDRLSKLNLIPPRIYKELRTRDSLDHLKDTTYLKKTGYWKTTTDTLETEDEPDLKAEKTKPGKNDKDSSNAPAKVKPEAVLPDNKKKATKDSINI